jgi:membrane-anchored mycosin MYCP
VRVSRALRGGLAGGLALGVLAVGAAPAHAEDQECSGISVQTTEPAEATSTSAPAQLMQVAQAQRIAARSGTGPGEGVTVAVLDSGVAPSTRLTSLAQGPSVGRSPELLDYQGTAVAGLIAGRGEADKPIGVAPEARILDVRVYDRREAEPSLDLLIRGLRYVADLPRGTVGVVNVSLTLGVREELADDLRAVLADLAAKDVVVVAATGDRPGESEPLYAVFGYAEREGEDQGQPPPGEDAGGAIWPAAAPHVVGVNATGTTLVEEEVVADDAADSVLRSSDTDLAAPTSGAVSLGMDGRSTCVIREVSSEYAAAEVSGVVALLRSAFPGESAAQIVARLTRTATGSPLTRNVLTGHGIVQPVEALNRPLKPGKKGRLPATTADDRGDERAAAPREEPDVLASTKRHAVWWGLLAGGALVVAMLLRPVLARRRD